MKESTHIQALFTPCMLVLTPEERREMSKTDARAIALVEKNRDFARRNLKSRPALPRH